MMSAVLRVSVNAQYAAYLAEERERLHLPVADPIRGGPAFEDLISSCLRSSAP